MSEIGPFHRARRPTLAPGIGASGVLLLLGIATFAAAGAAAPSPTVRTSPAALSVGAWSNLTSTAGVNPGGRADGGFAWDPLIGKAVWFGGFKDTCAGGCAVALNYTLTYRGTWNNISARVGAAPPARWAIEHGLTYDGRDHYVLLFGGMDNRGNSFNDTWTFSGGTWTNRTGTTTSTPPARYFDSLAYDPASRSVVLFGGASWGSGTYYNDTWTYAGGTWTQLILTHAPSPRRAANLAYDPACRCVLLEGGVTSGGVGLNDTWFFKAGAWHQLALRTLPPARWISAMAYDPAHSAMVLYGGCTALGCTSDLNDTWYFAHGHWTDLTARLPVTPLPIGGSSGIYDPLSKEFVVFGGLPPPGLQYTNQTWGYS